MNILFFNLKSCKYFVKRIFAKCIATKTMMEHWSLAMKVRFSRIHVRLKWVRSSQLLSNDKSFFKLVSYRNKLTIVKKKTKSQNAFCTKYVFLIFYWELNKLICIPYPFKCFISFELKKNLILLFSFQFHKRCQLSIGRYIWEVIFSRNVTYICFICYLC